MAAGQSAIEARGVTKLFQGAGQDAVKALDDVSVTIRENEFFTLLGPSGCGKTTLLRLIAGFDYPTAGEILLYGQDIAPLPPMGSLVFEGPIGCFVPVLRTVGQNIGFGLEMLGKPRPEIEARVNQMLKLVRMEELKNRKTSQISGGQQQRVALARALAPAPKVLLLDEPLSALDAKLRKDMQIELKRLQHETGITFIFVTHDQEEALTMSDRIAVMSKGRILQVGSPRDIYDRPSERFVANFIGETNFLKAAVESVTADRAQVRLASGSVIAASLPENFSPKGEVTIVIRPEHAQLAARQSGALAGTLENIVYFGTDTHYHLRLGDGSEFTVRQQNSRTAVPAFTEGSPVGIAISADAAQVLRD